MATARTLDQIIAELNPTYQAQTNSLQQQMGLIPQEIQTQEAALNAQKEQGYADILSGARRRGTGVAFGGIPLAEQAKYNATTYTPALANLRLQGQQKAMSLQDAILGINERRDVAAQNIYQTEQERAFAEQENAKNRSTTASSAFSPTNFADYFSSPTSTTTASLPQITRDTKKGYNFSDSYGTPISAAEYIKLYQSQGGQLSYRQLLQKMANDGDANAKIALNYVGDDARFSNAPSQYKRNLEVLGATGSYKNNTQAPSLTQRLGGMSKIYNA